MGLLIENGPYKPRAPRESAPQPQQPSAAAQQTPTSATAPRPAAPQPQAGSLTIKKLWVDGVIQNGIFFHLLLLADALPPAGFTLDCDVELTHVGLLGKETTVLRTGGPKPHKLSVVHKTDGSGKPKAKRLEDGTYELEFSLEYAGASGGINGNIKRGTHRLSVSITGDALKAPFACVDEFKA